jgi:hypothetical protein
MKKQRRVLVWHERTHCYIFLFPRARRTWGCGAVAGHSAIQAGGPGTIDVNSAFVSPHFFLFFVLSTVTVLSEVVEDE